MAKTADIINPGRLRRRIQLEKDVLSNVNGEEVREATVYATVWAEVEDAGGNETQRDKGVVSLSLFNFLIRYRTDVSAAHRVLFNGHRMEIVAVHADEQRKRYMTLECHAND